MKSRPPSTVQPESSNQQGRRTHKFELDAPDLCQKEAHPTIWLRITTCLHATSRLCAALILLLLLLQSVPATAADRTGNEFLAGYITSILERDLHWEGDSYILNVVSGVATITLLKDDEIVKSHLRPKKQGER